MPSNSIKDHVKLESVYGGLFKDPSYISTDPDPNKTDPYDKQDCIPSRYLGKGMKTGPPEDYFSKQFLTLASTEQNAATLETQKRSKRKTGPMEFKNVSEEQFRYPSFPQKSTGPGSYYGCFQSKPFEYMTEPWEDGKGTKKEVVKANDLRMDARGHLPNIKTNPPKKGTYGFPGLLLTKESYNENWKIEHEAEEANTRTKMKPPVEPVGPTFRVPAVTRAYLDSMPYTGVSAIHANYQPPADTKKGKNLRKTAAPIPALQTKPFNWSVAKRTEAGCINTFPNTWIDPATIQPQKKNRKGREKGVSELEESSQHLKGAPVWKCSSYGKTSIISSCLRRFY